MSHWTKCGLLCAFTGPAGGSMGPGHVKLAVKINSSDVGRVIGMYAM
jgi:hypothetical protein